MGADPRPPRPPVALIFTVTATAIMGNTLVAPALPEITAGVGAPTGAAGLVIGAMTLPGVLLAPVIGVLADRLGRRRVLVPCLALFGVGGALSALAPDLETLVGLRLLQGVGSAGLMNLAVVIIGDHWQGVERSRMIGRNAAVLTACLSIFPLIGGGLAETFGWQAPFLLYPLALVTALLVRVRLAADVPTNDVSVLDQLRGVGPALRSPQLLAVLGAGGVVFAIIFGLLITVLPLYLEQAFGLSETLRGVVLGVPALANTVAALSLGRLRARFGSTVLLVVGSGFLTVGLAAVPLAPGWVPILGAITVFGLGDGLVVPTLQDLAASAGDASQRGTIVALFVSVARLGQSLGPVAATGAFSAGGAPAAFAAGAVVAVLLGLGLAAVGRRAPGPSPN